jgi:hypothetical protein
MSSVRNGLGQLKTFLYRQPKDELQRLLRWGPTAYFHCDAWAREMEEAAWQLPEDRGRKTEGGEDLLSSNRPLSSDLRPPTSNSSPPVSLWFLTGKRFWYQTAFCAWTFARQSGREVVLNLVDDGTLDARYEEGLRRIFPEGVTLRKEAVSDRIETLLPIDRFPILRQRWNDYIHIRKLTDIHLGSTGVKLVLDSDMLFFRCPVALLEWWDASHGTGDSGQETVPLVPSSLSPVSSLFSPCLMTDCVESYGYSRALMEELTETRIPPLLNVGICGLRSEDLNWEEMEHWCRTLLEREGTTYYLEQALVAMHASRMSSMVLPPEDYITFPSRIQGISGDGVMQHYVADSKPWYFGSAWKRALK